MRHPNLFFFLSEGDLIDDMILGGWTYAFAGASLCKITSGEGAAVGIEFLVARQKTVGDASMTSISA